MPERDNLPRVELRGNAVDLENLATVLSDGDHRVAHEEGLWWLRSKEFEGLISDPDQLRARTGKLLPLINGAAKARIPGFEPVELGECVDWVRADGQMKRRLTDVVKLRVRSAQRVAPSDEATTIRSDLDGWIAAGRRDERVADVLRVWGSAPKHDWRTLFNLKEKIEDAPVGARNIVENNWATSAELERFARTANSKAAVGDAARHGVQITDPPSNPMALDEAHELLERLIRHWVVGHSWR